jgi:predicted ATPase/class 3 adenylate cyclase
VSEATAARRPNGTAALDDAFRHGGEGIFTLLFTDIEDSTRLWETYPTTMEGAVRAHNDLVAACSRHAGGRVVRYMGDGAMVAFLSALEAVNAAIDIQRRLAASSWPEVGELHVRIGLNTGWCHVVDGEVFGRPPNLAARLEAAAHGGQVLVSDTTAQACAGALGPGVQLFNLGRYHIRGFDHPVIVHAVVADGLRAVFPPLRTPYRGFDELPPDDAPLYGRDGLVELVARLLHEGRLVTLWGPGGVGKTRVALRVASRARRPYDDGVRFVDLSLVDAPGGLAGALAAALRAQPVAGEDEHDTVVRVLRHSRLLLVLDNCEAVVDALLGLVPTLLDQCPGVRVVATSRELLSVPGEQAVEVPTLAVPSAEERDPIRALKSEAVRVFARQAKAVVPDFAVDASNVAAVVSLCRALDGLPLALELAAARLDVETLDELAAGLPESAVRLEPAGGAGSPFRSGSAPLAWGLSRLSPSELDLFSRLGTFAGSFTREMALRMAPDLAPSARDFDRLVRTSLVVRDATVPGRFKLLAITRADARQLAGAEGREANGERHARLMLERSEECAPRFRARDERACVDVVRADFADHRAAVAHFLDRSAVVEAGRLVIALFPFALFQPRPEVHRWAATVARAIDDDAPGAAEVVGAAALGAWYAADIDRALALGSRAITIAEAHGGSTISARTALVNAYGYSADMDALVRQFGALRDELYSSGDPFWRVDALGFEAIALTMAGRPEAAEEPARQALAIARELGNPDCTQWALHALGRALAPRDPQAACDAFEAAMEAARTVESRFNIALALVEWVGLRRRLGDVGNALGGALDLLDMIAVSGNRSQLSQALREAGLVLADAGHREVAALVLLGRRGLPQMPKAPYEAPEDDAAVEELRHELGPAWDRLALRAAAMPEHELISLCRAELAGLAHTA